MVNVTSETPGLLAQQNDQVSGVVGLFFVLIYLAIIIAALAGMWKTFEKAGKPGWAAIVPIYNIAAFLFEIGWKVSHLVADSAFHPLCKIIADSDHGAPIELDESVSPRCWIWNRIVSSYCRLFSIRYLARFGDSQICWTKCLDVNHRLSTVVLERHGGRSF